MKSIESKLFELRDSEYRDFHAKLIPTVPKEKIIGVRVPLVRKLAKEINKSDIKYEFMAELPHKYFEENNLHAFLIEQIKDFDVCVSALDNFLLYVDNWATCDSMAPKILGKEPEKLYEKITQWAASPHTYCVRFAVVCLTRYFTGELLDKKHLALVLSIKSDEYYINMAISWYLATLLSTNYEAVIPYFENQKFSSWIHNKAIQKAVESFRVTDEHKAYLKTLKIK